MAKRNIDFEVYERQDTSAQVNWTKAAADLTTTLTDIRNDRVKRKDALNQEYLDTQDIVNDLGQYDNTTVQTLVMNIANGAGEMATNLHNEVKAGRAKPSEQNMFMHNLTTDFTLLKKNALGFDTAFKKFAEREQLQKSALAEGWWAGQLTGFASLDNYDGVTDALTGKISLIHKTDPSKSTTLQQLTLLMNQQIDAFDKKAQVALATADLGVMVESEWNSRNPGRNYKQLDKEEQTAFGERFIEENEDNPEFQDFMKSSESLLIGSPQQQADMLAKLVPGPDGKVGYYKNGSQDDFDAWEKDNPGVKAVKVPELPPGDMTTEGTKFRKWLRETYSEYATDNEISAEGSNDFIQAAYAEYGEEYAKDFLGIEPTTTKGVNPIMVQYMGDDGLAKVTITDDQDEASRRLANQLIIRSQNQSYTVSAVKAGENAPSTPRETKTAAQIAEEKALEKQSSRLGEYIIAYTDADPAKREAAMDNLIVQGNAKIKAANAKLSSPDDYSPTIFSVDPVDPKNPDSSRTIVFSDGTRRELTGDFTEQTITLDFIVNPEDPLTRDSTEELAGLRGFDPKTGITSAGDATTVSQAVYELPDYDVALDIEGYGGDGVTAENYMNSEFGFTGHSGHIDRGVDNPEEVGDVFVSMIKGAVTSEVLKNLKDNGKGLSYIVSEDRNNNPIVTFNFGGQTYEIGASDTAGKTRKLYDIYAPDVWQELQDNLLNPVLKAYNKVRSGRVTSGTEGTGGKEVETESGRTYK